MSNTKQDELQNGVFVLKNDLLDYAKKIAKDDADSTTSVVEVVYNVLLQIGNQGNNTEETKKLRKAFQGIPLAMHTQALRSFIVSFYYVNHLDQALVPSNQVIKSVVAEMMATTEHFSEIGGQILSPFEAIYLTIDSFVQDNVLKDPKRHEQADVLIGNIKAQRRILNDYLKEYDAKYGAELRKEVSADD